MASASTYKPLSSLDGGSIKRGLGQTASCGDLSRQLVWYLGHEARQILQGQHSLSQGYALLLALGLLCPKGLEVACGLSL